MDVIESFGVPKLAYLGVNKDTIGRVSMRKEAHWKCPHQKYFSLNLDFAEHRKRRVIVIDIDDRWEDDAWQIITGLILDGELPRPAFASTRLTRKNGIPRRTRAHLIFLLDYPVNEANQRQRFFMNVVLDAFYDVLEENGVPVDRSQGVTFKNPAAAEWDVAYFGDHRHSLNDWAELFGISDLSKEEQKAANWARRSKQKARRLEQLAEVHGERNMDVFEIARHLCYAEKHHHSNYLSFFDAVAGIVCTVHGDLNYAVGLSSKELRQITKSIAKWTWDTYEGQGYCPRNRGACAGLLAHGMGTEDRQRIGAGYAHDKRTQKVIRKIREARDALLAAGERISVRILAKAAGVAVSTAHKYRKVVEQGADLPSKALSFTQEIKDRLARIAIISEDTAPFDQVYRGGVSELPHRGLISNLADKISKESIYNKFGNGRSEQRPDVERFKSGVSTEASAKEDAPTTRLAQGSGKSNSADKSKSSSAGEFSANSNSNPFRFEIVGSKNQRSAYYRCPQKLHNRVLSHAGQFHDPSEVPISMEEIKQLPVAPMCVYERARDRLAEETGNLEILYEWCDHAVGY